jgi:hypothetical protein
MMPPANRESRDMPRTGEQKVLIRVKRAMGRVGDDEDAGEAWWRSWIVDVLVHRY